MTTFYKLARELVDQCVDRGEFVGYADHELDGRIGELSAEFEQTWIDYHAEMQRDEPTPEDRRTENVEQSRGMAA